LPISKLNVLEIRFKTYHYRLRKTASGCQNNAVITPTVNYIIGFIQKNLNFLFKICKKRQNL